MWGEYGRFEVCERLKANFGQETADLGLTKHLGPINIDLGPGRADLKLVEAGLVPSKVELRPKSADQVPERASWEPKKRCRY